MPDITLDMTQELQEKLEQVRHQQGLQSIEQAAEWLAKNALRKRAGRLRKLTLVTKP